MASKANSYLRGCLGKQRYADFGEAQVSILGINSRKGYRGHLMPYRCKHCGGYHFGHLSKKRR